ncbi:hypothetical protein SAMN05216359_101500 [Roseateles sp. YR242]|uniref:hypothetical protein n=1 Tax=Roseateles sp. YR242 TaxID=1855305 RepID=UPI0008AF1425|nr:hypothetical protein [Roseateles sp. YR242]SEK34444.1 hypothetical protein SAMN05216359_101500 [Roseateles sp. YR242]
MRWLKFSASVLVILWAVAANFLGLALPDGATIGDMVFGVETSKPREIGPIQPKHRPAKPADASKNAHAAPAAS